MKYLHYQVRTEQHESIIVKLNDATNFAQARVLLLDTGNYYKYRLGKACEFKQQLGGAPTVILDPPYKSDWHVIIELRTSGEIKAFVEVRRKGP
ncbi:MAG: DUF1883 domain-containing protein [Spirochaetales bacterium]|jgi:hypothetical protein|nr:DUF1883 domain-containing protein [Spirochaetales bacterium]